MATNLLLEGDDLEALLLKAHAEGGPTARIVRADKYRHGGIWGFFARERFEVAVEIPGTTASRRSGDVARPGGRTVPTGGTSFFLPEADEAPVGPPPPSRRSRKGAPAGSSIDALLSMAERASAAEARQVDLPSVEKSRSGRSADLVGAGIRPEGTAVRTSARTERRSAPIFGTTTPRGEAALAALAAAEAGVTPLGPDEPGAEETFGSTSRPEFTALLDALRTSGPDGGPGSGPDDGPPHGTGAVTGIDTGEPLGPLPSRDLPDPGPAGDPRADADRSVLAALGVPEPWTTRYRPGDRFSEVLKILEYLPEPDIDPDATVVAVVGPTGTVALEAYRTALDLAEGHRPRPVVVVPAEEGPEREDALVKARYGGPVVVAVESDGGRAAPVLDTLAAVGARVVLTVVDATVPLEHTRRWLSSLGSIDALVLDRTFEVRDPAAALQLGLPIVRLDGIPIDRVTWTALLCARLVAAEQSAVTRR